MFQSCWSLALNVGIGEREKPDSCNWLLWSSPLHHWHTYVTTLAVERYIRKASTQSKTSRHPISNTRLSLSRNIHYFNIQVSDATDSKQISNICISILVPFFVRQWPSIGVWRCQHTSAKISLGNLEPTKTNQDLQETRIIVTSTFNSPWYFKVRDFRILSISFPGPRETADPSICHSKPSACNWHSFDDIASYDLKYLVARTDSGKALVSFY